MYKKNLGFTLIEMLVVVGIIAVLSVVALTSLGPSREKARDTRIVTDVNQVRTIAELVFNADNKFDNLSSTPYLNSIRESISKNGGLLEVHGGGLKYCARSKLLSNNTLYYCVDSNGFSGYVSSTSCTSGNISCVSSGNNPNSQQ